MVGSVARDTSGRGSTALAAVGAMIVTLLALLGVTASPAAAADVITFRASTQATWNQTTARVTIPATVREGDGMLLFVTTNKAFAGTTATPAGWTLEDTRLSSTDTETTLYSKVAEANDAGRNAALTFSSTTKSALTLLAYDGTAADPVSAFTSAAETVNRTTHTTPVANVGTAGSYVVSYWADKSASSTTGWTLPGGQTQRSIALGTGAGRITSVASDGNAPTGTGSTTSRTATGAVSTAKATMWTVVLQADQTVNPNVAPVASFTVSCPTATCTVDASASSDTSPGTISSYAWDFGDGSTGTGLSTTHAYATGGAKTITLVVTDDQGLPSAPATRTANPVVGGGGGGQGVPGHTRLVPDKPRTNTPRISSGEIWDIEVIPSLNRVFIAGNFTSLANTIAPTTTINQANLASYNLQTGLIDTSFRPTFNGGVTAVEASPDGTKLFVGGSFSTVNGVAKQKVASLNLTTGAPLTTFGFSNSTNNQVTALAASNSTLYVGGRFSRVNGVLLRGLAAVNAASGAVDQTFDNQLSGGIGVDGQLGVPQLKLTHDGSKLLVVHTGRQIDGQDRYGMGIIDTATKELLPWRSQLWDTNLARVGGVTRIAAGDISPDDSYFVVSSGSGGDAPPISDTAIAFPLNAASLQDSDVQPLWISRHFDSIYSVAITEVAVYVGGHFGFIESPSSDDPWPGLDNVGYGTGQGLAGYGLGDQVVRRDHIAAINPVDGKSLEWYPVSGSNSFEGDKAMEATPRGLFIGGDGQWKGGVNTGRVAFFDMNSVTFPAALPDTTITTPIEGRVVANNAPFDITGTARVNTGTVGRVQVQVQDRDSGQYLQDNGTAFTTFGNTANTLNATLSGTGTTRTWSIPATVTTNRNLRVYAQAFTAATGGTGDATRASKLFESFSTEDQTPTTGISGPSGIQTSTTFTVTGTANDDLGVNSLSFWFRDEQQRYLQNDGTVSAIFNTFRGTPDVVGATNATWSYEVTLPHEGVWRGSATATDTIGQADLRSATRDWTIDSNAISPTVTIQQPVQMTPPFTVPAMTVEPGGRITFSGTAEDDEGLKNVEISLRNSSTGEGLRNDGTWGVGQAGNYRISPVDIAGSTYNWSYTTPFDLSAGTYSFTVRATDDDDLVTSSTNQGRLTINAQFAGDLPPNATMSFVAPTDESLTVNLSGTATDDIGVERVRVSLQDQDTGRYLQANGTMAAAIAYRDATLTPPNATSTAWSLPAITLPTGGNWRFSALANDRVQQDPSAATASYQVYPNDGPPALSDTLGQPQNGATFDDGRIVVTGRAEDAADANASIASVRVAVVNAAGQYMSSTGTFTSTTASFRTAFLNSPGSAGSNYSYTTPVIPAGTYSVQVQAVDLRNQLSDNDPLAVGDQPRIATGVTVTQPANNPPVASFTYSCTQNVCTFDGRGSTDETPTSLAYTWSFGGTGTTTNGTGPLPTRTFTAPGTFPVTLTVTDEWTATNTSAAQNVTIVEPPGNSAPVPTFIQNCQGLTCSVSSAGTVDPNTGDSIAYSWNWGDGTALSTGASPAAHAYAAAGSYTITLTTTDGWGDAASTTRNVTLSEPAGNQPPSVAFTTSCPTYTTCQMNSAGTVDPDGDAITYSWNFGDTGTSTSASPSRTYAAPGTYTITLTVRDVWGKTTTVTHDVTITEPAGNTGPSATFVATCTVLVCAMNSTGTVDPEGHTIKSYTWNWGDGTALGTGTSPSHTYALPGTYTITLTATDSWNRSGAPVTRDVTMQEPAGNQGPTAVMPAPTCTTTNTTCAFTSTGTSDPEGHTPLRYVWNWGDGTAASTTASGSHVFPVAGTYTVTLTVSDAWGRAGTPVTREVTTSPEPGGNTGPAVTFPQPICTGRSCAVSSAGTTDPDGIRSYSWNWGDATTASTGAAPAAHLYAAAGTFTITLTVTDNWGKTSVVTRTVTVT
jgi:large repetitive protein